MNNDVEIVSSEIHGKGVFAKKSIPIGTKYKVDLILVDKQYLYDNLARYSFPFNRENSCICIGFQSFLNHSFDSNIKILSLDQIKKVKTFITTKDIIQGEELLITYGPNPEF